MPPVSYAQTSFLGGEWSSYSHGRFDLPAHKTALSTCLNSIPIEEGVVVRRPGTQWAGYTKFNQAARVRSIDFSGAAPATAELSANSVRFRFGADLAYTNGTVGISISAATPAILTTTGAPASWKTGTPICFPKALVPRGASTQNMAYAFNKVFTLTKLAHDTFSLALESTGAAASGALINWQAGNAFSVAEVVDLATPYNGTDWQQVRFVQAEFQVAMLHPAYPPQMLTMTPLPNLTPANQFTPSAGNMQYNFAAINFIDGPYLDPSSTPELVATSSTSGPGTLQNFVVTSIADLNGGSGFQSSDVGRLIRMHNEPPPWSPLAGYAAGSTQEVNGPGGYVFDPASAMFHGSGTGAGTTLNLSASQFQNVVSYPGPNGVNLYYACTGNLLQTSAGPPPSDYITNTMPIFDQEPDVSPVSWTPSLTAHTWTWGIITAAPNPTTITVLMLGPPLLWAGLPMVYAMGKYSTTTGWPTNGCYHEGRFWLGGAEPNSFDGSVANNVFGNSALGQATPAAPQLCFAPTDAGGLVALYGQVTDANAISETLNASEVNEIVWMIPNAQGIVAGTAGGEYLIQATNQNNVLTPTSIQAHRVTKYGCANIEPRSTGLTTVFVQRYGRRLFEFLTDVFSGKFYGPNLTEFAKKLTVPGIAELADQQEKAPIVWMRLSGPLTVSGLQHWLIGTTYRRVSLFSTEPPKFNGWHRHALGSGYAVQSITSGPSPDTLTESVTMTTSDPTGVLNQVEIMTPLFDEDDTLISAWMLDMAITPPAAATSGSGFPAGGITLLGLDHLNTGSPVTVFLAGLNCGQFTAGANGQIFVPYGSDPDKLLTLAYVTALSGAYGVRGMPIDNNSIRVPCVVGYPYTSQGQLIRPTEPVQGGNGPLIGKTRRHHMFAALLRSCISGTISFGTDFAATLMPALFRSPGNIPYQGNQMFNGVYWNTIGADYNFENALAWQITGPYPGAVVALEGFYSVQDR